jgi:hypothetical protein
LSNGKYGQLPRALLFWGPTVRALAPHA